MATIELNAAQKKVVAEILAIEDPKLQAQAIEDKIKAADALGLDGNAVRAFLTPAVEEQLEAKKATYPYVAPFGVKPGEVQATESVGINKDGYAGSSTTLKTGIGGIDPKYGSYTAGGSINAPAGKGDVSGTAFINGILPGGKIDSIGTTVLPITQVGATFDGNAFNAKNISWMAGVAALAPNEVGVVAHVSGKGDGSNLALTGDLSKTLARVDNTALAGHVAGVRNFDAKSTTGVTGLMTETKFPDDKVIKAIRFGADATFTKVDGQSNVDVGAMLSATVEFGAPKSKDNTPIPQSVASDSINLDKIKAQEDAAKKANDQDRIKVTQGELIEQNASKESVSGSTIRVEQDGNRTRTTIGHQSVAADPMKVASDTYFSLEGRQQEAFINNMATNFAKSTGANVSGAREYLEDRFASLHAEVDVQQSAAR